MIEAKKELLKSYISSNVAPILIDFLDEINIQDNMVVLPANCKEEELVGHYEETQYLPPQWLNQLYMASAPTILLIDKIDSILKNEQIKFKEILEYKKVSTFEIPKNTVIIVTAKEINKETINEEIYSLVAHITG